MDNFPIDFIITWVDGNDPEWQAEKAKYKGTGGDSRNSRYRDFDTLRYLFRSIETNAPFVNRVFLVTCGHLPSWLNTDSPKLVTVRHSDYIPEEFLPTFSSRTIDMNFHRIPQLSEHFVYFNDDMILTRKVDRDDFFSGGLPCDTAILRPAVVYSGRNASAEKTSQMYLAPVIDMALVNRYFDKHRVIKENFRKWYSLRYGKEMIKTLTLAPWDFFPGIREYHCCYSYLKSTYEELWKLEGEAFSEVCRHRFRVNTDYNHWVFSYWQIAKGTFAPRSPRFGTAYTLCDDDKENEKILSSLEKTGYSLVCLNDNVSDEKSEDVYRKLGTALDRLFPQKSSFEK